MVMIMNISFNFTRANFILKSCSRYLSLQIEQLHRRSLIKLCGEDVFPYLQGLITNDVNHLTDNGSAIFTHILNNKGRVLYDALILRSSIKELLLECDLCIRNDLIKHLKMYRVRKKIDVEPVDWKVWVLFDDSCDTTINCEVNEPEYKIIESALRNKNIVAFPDPRVRSLGMKVFTRESENLISILSESGINTMESSNHVILRYKLGVAEGASELPVGKCFPLEANCDYLHGVSFHKGCYIGQEVTARTHHIGVVRKRIMPLILSSVPDEQFEYDSIVITEDDKVVGKLRGLYKNYGIGLLRLSECLDNVSQLKLNGIPVSTHKPFWWPQKSKEDSSRDSSISGQHIKGADRFNYDYMMEAANHIAQETFRCSQCTLKENYHYFGRQPPFNNKVKFKEHCYIVKDPFSPANKNQFLILGSNCSLCSKAVCQSPECSIFFTKRFCNQCIRDNLDCFPVQIQTKFLKSQA